MIEFSDATIHLEVFGDVSIYLGVGIQIIFALILGGIVGYDREVKLKAAGLKTNIMICIGATLYTTMSILSLESTSAMVDPNRVAAQIVSGIGFLGAGAIIQSKGSVTGLTTAATIWVVAAIGYCIGVGFPIVATLFSVTALVILKLIHPLNRIMEKEKDFHLFHLELLCSGKAWQIVQDIFENEKARIEYAYEERHFNDTRSHVINLYIRGHSRAIERISGELIDSIKIQKTNFRRISKLPENDLSEDIKVLQKTA